MKGYSFYFIVTAILYAIAGMGLGLYMHITKDFRYIPLHGHVDSLGWLSLAVLGLLYRAFPGLAENKLAPFHFWIAQLGVIGLNGGLVLVYLDMTRIPIYVGTVLAPLSYLLFLIMFISEGRAAARQPAER